jgi:hypothetical protein
MVYCINQSMVDQSRLAYLTANYNEMLNLRFAPFYLLMILSPWTNVQRVGLGSVLGAFLIGTAWFLLLRRYYENHFGQVKSTSIRDLSNRSASTLVWVGLVILVYLVVHLRYEHADTTVLLLCSFLMIQRGIAFSGFPIRGGYYVGGAIVTLTPVLAALIPGTPGRAFFQAYDLTLLGCVWMTLAILDHVLLLQFLRPIGIRHA